MEKFMLFAVIVAFFGVQSDATVNIPYDEENYSPSSESQIQCIVTNETFTGWFKSDDTLIKHYAKRDDIPSDAFGSFCLSGGGVGERYCFLIIPANLQSTVGGSYICKGNTNKDSMRVVVKFNLANLQTSQQIHFGTKDKIVVGAISFPLTVFKWKKDGQTLDLDGGRITIENDGSLTFAKVKTTDGGSYEVDLNWENRNTAQKTISVAVVDKPVFISSPKPAKIIAIKGYDYEFCFNVTGIPTPKLEWLKSTVQFDTTNPRYSVTNGCMKIAKLEQVDVATYKCTAKNSAGEASSTVEIERIGAIPEIDDFPDTFFKANVGSKFELKCSGKGDPTPTLEWSRDGKIISSKENENTLIVTDVKDADSGNYTCTIRNKLFYKGKELTKSKTIGLLAVTIPSVDEHNSDKLLYSYPGNQIKVPIRCSFYGVPTPTVNISKNGTTLASGVKLAQYDAVTSKPSDFGDYICTATNIHGSGTHTVQLKQAEPPKRPTEVLADKTCRSITVKWKPPSHDGNSPVIQYVIAYEGGKHNVPEKDRKFEVPAKLKPKTNYEVKVRARNVVGLSLPEKITVTTDEFCAPSQASIYNLATSMRGPTIEVKWNAPDDDGFDKFFTYKVYWRQRTDPPQNWEVSEELDRFVLSYTIPKKLQSGVYEFKVTAKNLGGESEPSMRIVNVTSVEAPPVSDKRTGGLGKGIIAGIVIAILLIVLITIDLFCCFFNACGVIFSCQRACCGKEYEVDGKGKSSEMEKLNKNPKPENV